MKPFYKQPLWWVSSALQFAVCMYIFKDGLSWQSIGAWACASLFGMVEYADGWFKGIEQGEKN